MDCPGNVWSFIWQYFMGPTKTVTPDQIDALIVEFHDQIAPLKKEKKKLSQKCNDCEYEMNKAAQLQDQTDWYLHHSQKEHVTSQIEMLNQMIQVINTYLTLGHHRK